MIPAFSVYISPLLTLITYFRELERIIADNDYDKERMMATVLEIQRLKDFTGICIHPLYS